MQEQPVPPPQPQQQKVEITFVPNTPKIVCTVGGKYLGSITYDVASADALRPLAEVFTQFAAQASGGIQVANPAGIPGLRAS